MRRSLISLFALFFVWPVLAAEIRVIPNPIGSPDGPLQFSEDYRMKIDRWIKTRQDCFNNRYTIEHPHKAIVIQGSIEIGDAERFAKIAALYGGSTRPDDYKCADAVVMLNSQGGELREAISIGRTISNLGFATVLGPDAKCLSACIFALVGGTYLGGYPPKIVVFTGARIGLHQPQFLPTDRERFHLSLIEDARQVDMAYLLAGSEWKNIVQYLVGERRNEYLMRRLLYSPQKAEEFDWLDTYIEFSLARFDIIPTKASRRSIDDAKEDVRQKIGLEWLTSDKARLLCAFTLVRKGELADFSVSYATQLGRNWIVGLTEIDSFCTASVDSVGDIQICHFTGSDFGYDIDDPPSWFASWGSGSGEYNPISMFDFTSLDFEPNPTELANIVQYFERRLESGSLCSLGKSVYDIDTLIEFDASMRLSSDCTTPERICD